MRMAPCQRGGPGSYRGVRDQAGAAGSKTEVNASSGSASESVAARSVYLADAEKTEEAQRERGERRSFGRGGKVREGGMEAAEVRLRFYRVWRRFAAAPLCACGPVSAFRGRGGRGKGVGGIEARARFRARWATAFFRQAFWGAARPLRRVLRTRGQHYSLPHRPRRASADLSRVTLTLPPASIWPVSSWRSASSARSTTDPSQVHAFSGPVRRQTGVLISTLPFR